MTDIDNDYGRGHRISWFVLFRTTMFGIPRLQSGAMYSKLVYSVSSISIRDSIALGIRRRRVVYTILID